MPNQEAPKKNSSTGAKFSGEDHYVRTFVRKVKRRCGKKKALKKLFCRVAGKIDSPASRVAVRGTNTASAAAFFLFFKWAQQFLLRLFGGASLTRGIMTRRFRNPSEKLPWARLGDDRYMLLVVPES